jgi:hypothetical protein
MFAPAFHTAPFNRGLYDRVGQSHLRSRLADAHMSLCLPRKMARGWRRVIRGSMGHLIWRTKARQ